MFKKLLLITLFALLASPSFAQVHDVFDFDVTGTYAAITFSATTETTTRVTQPVAIPEGVEYAHVMLKSGVRVLGSTDSVAGPINDATFSVNMSYSAGISNQMADSEISALSMYNIDPNDESFDLMPTANIANYGLYFVPTYGAKYLNVAFTTSAATVVDNTIIVDFNPPPR